MKIQHNQSGRSMVEMLGVLAIIGVLSIGGVAGYRYAMTKHKQNEFFSRLSILLMDRTTKNKTGIYDCASAHGPLVPTTEAIRNQRTLDATEFLEVPGVWDQANTRIDCEEYTIQLPVDSDILDQNFVLGLKSLVDNEIVEDIVFLYHLKDISDEDFQRLLHFERSYEDIEPIFIIYERY